MENESADICPEEAPALLLLPLFAMPSVKLRSCDLELLECYLSDFMCPWENASWKRERHQKDMKRKTLISIEMMVFNTPLLREDKGDEYTLKCSS
jgi:hypothetical protein